MTQDLIQGSPEWLAARCGKVTASRIADVVAKTKSGWGASRANYMAELIAERLTGSPAERFQNDAMRWGTEKEPEARNLYAFSFDHEITEVGFIPHPALAETGASPDGLVGDEGLVEIKCPTTATHLDTLLAGSIAEKYRLQMQWQMACTGRRWCDFVSYDPRLPARMRLYVERFERDDELIASLERDVADFIRELSDKVAKLLSIYSEEALAA